MAKTISRLEALGRACARESQALAETDFSQEDGAFLTGQIAQRSLELDGFYVTPTAIFNHMKDIILTWNGGIPGGRPDNDPAILRVIADLLDRVDDQGDLMLNRAPQGRDLQDELRRIANQLETPNQKQSKVKEQK
jgi:hypothetical protein